MRDGDSTRTGTVPPFKFGSDAPRIMYLNPGTLEFPEPRAAEIASQ